MYKCDSCPITSSSSDGWWQEWTHESHRWVCPKCYNQRALINLKERMLKEITEMHIEGFDSPALQATANQIKQRAFEIINRVDIYEP